MSQQYHNKKALAKAVSDAVAASSTDNLARGVEIYNTYPTAQVQNAFGVGMCQIVDTGTVYVSNGVSWIELDRKSQSPRALILGTSITAMYSAQRLNPTYINEARINSNSYLFWALVSANQPFSSVINAGVGGNTTTQMLARYAPDVIAQYDNFDVLIFEPGPNDFSNDTLLLAEIQSNYQTIITSAIAAKKYVVVVTPTPSESVTAAGELKRAQLLAWLPGYIASVPGVKLINSGDVLGDPASGAPLSDLYLPTSTEATRVHPSIQGGQVLGRKLARAFGDQFGRTYLVGDKRSHLQYFQNPRLQGGNASGSKNFYAGTGVTGTGPDATAIGYSAGTWVSPTNTCAIAPTVLTGIEDSPSGGTTITITNAPSDNASVDIMFGANHNSGLTTQFGFLNGAFSWTTSKVVNQGDHVVNGSYPLGMWTCVKAGTTAGSGTVPLPVSDTNYGELKTDGSVIWMWQKKPAVGDVFIAEVSYEIVSQTGGISLAAEAIFTANDESIANMFGGATFPFRDSSMGLPGIHIPRKGKLRSLPVTLVTPSSAGGIRYAEIRFQVYCASGASATIAINEVNLLRVEA